MAIELPVEKDLRKVRSFSIKESNIATLEEYAKLMNRSASAVVDVMIEHYLSKVLANEKEKREL